MSRMKTFGKYILLILLFFIFSNFVSDLLIKTSYNDLSKNTNIAKSEEGLTIEMIDVSANKRQGIFKGKVTNTSDQTIPLKYIRIRAYDDDILLQTRYVKIENLLPKQTKEFEVIFSADGINRYEVDYLDEMPDDKTFLDDLIDNIKKFVTGGEKSVKGAVEKMQFVKLEGPDWASIAAVLLVFYFI